MAILGRRRPNRKQVSNPGASLLPSTFTLTDAATGTDTLTVAATVPLADTSSGAETIAAGVPITLPGDTGTGADGFTVTLRLVPLTDTASGADSVFVPHDVTADFGTVVLATAGAGAAAVAGSPSGTVVLASANAGLATVQT